MVRTHALCIFILCMKIAFLTAQSAPTASPTVAALAPLPCYPMTLVEGGSFIMGAVDWYFQDDEFPSHRVSLPSFWIGTYELTQELEQEVRGGTLSQFKGPLMPAQNLSWGDAVKICNDLSLREGLQPAYVISEEGVSWDRSANGYRLPTEAEWEYAAKGGKKNIPGGRYAGGMDLSNRGWWGGNSPLIRNQKMVAHPVGLKLPNELGIYDMSGNVGEWCWDYYGPYSEEDQTDPVGPVEGRERISRGGSYDAGAAWCATTVRVSLSTNTRFNGYGMRVARNYSEEYIDFLFLAVNGFKADAYGEYLKKALTALGKDDLRLLRNYLFALYGYAFKDAGLKGYFEKLAWYKQNPAATMESIKLPAERQALLEMILAEEKKR